MAERRRRASTSSVETVDDSQVRWLQETSVVRSLPSDSDLDDWPCFELHDVAVYDRLGLAFDNPLYVSTKGPFSIRGRLIITEPSQKAHLISRVRSSTPIEIRNCTRYSIGLQRDGDVERPCIWVAGKGGWYEIQPSEAYLPIYLKMCEATTMYYTFVDSYTTDILPQRPHKKSSKISRLEKLHDIFLLYATKVGDGSTIDEVVERCREHAPFFINHFREESVDIIVWKDTDFYKWFMHEFADVASEIENLIRNPNTDYRPPSINAALTPSRERSLRSSTRSTSIDNVSSTKTPAIQVAERPKSTSHKAETNHTSSVPPNPKPVVPVDTTIPSADQSDESEALASVVAALEHIHSVRGSTKKGLVTATTLNTLYFDYKFPNYRDGTSGCHKVPVIELLHFHAKGLLQHLDEAKFARHEIYGYIRELSQQEFKYVAWKASDFPLRLVPRKPMQKQVKNADVKETPSDAASAVKADDEDKAIARPMGKSIKRPGQRSRKSGLRTMSSKKRTHSELQSDMESDSEASAVKRSHYLPDEVLDDMEMDFASQDTGAAQRQAVSESESESDEEEQPVEKPIPIVLRVERIPSTVPRGPDGTWTCDQRGCEYVVRGGSDQECQERIRRHFEEHEEQAQRLNLAVAESTRGHMPVNHLLDKLKKMGDDALDRERRGYARLTGSEGLRPIKRKLIV